MLLTYYFLIFGLFSVYDYEIPKNASQIKSKIREEFLKNSSVKDIRVIDMLVIKVIFLLPFTLFSKIFFNFITA